MPVINNTCGSLLYSSSSCLSTQNCNIFLACDKNTTEVRKQIIFVLNRLRLNKIIPRGTYTPKKMIGRCFIVFSMVINFENILIRESSNWFHMVTTLKQVPG